MPPTLPTEEEMVYTIPMNKGVIAMKVTMKMIAERCGVSKSLISRILNEDPTLRVTPETRQRVISTVEELQYRRDVNARILSTSRTPKDDKQRRIGYLTFSARKHTGHPYFSHIIDGIMSEAAQHHAQVLISMGTEEAHMQMSALLKVYGETPLDGLILLGRISDPGLRQTIRQIARYVVCLDGQFDKKSDYVGTDSTQSIIQVLEHLHKLGYTEYGLLHGWPDGRMETCSRWLEEHGLTLLPEWSVNGEFTLDIAENRIAKVLEEHKPPRAIVACNDEMAIGCIRALQNAGYRVPEDVAVTGHDDISLAAYVDVPLTTVHVYKKELGRLAVKILLDRVETGRKPPVSMEVASKLVKRDSCGWRLSKDK